MWGDVGGDAGRDVGGDAGSVYPGQETPDASGDIESADDPPPAVSVSPNDKTRRAVGARFDDDPIGSGLKAASLVRYIEVFGHEAGRRVVEHATLEHVALLDLGGMWEGRVTRGGGEAEGEIERARSGEIVVRYGEIAHLDLEEALDVIVRGRWWGEFRRKGPCAQALVPCSGLTGHAPPQPVAVGGLDAWEIWEIWGDCAPDRTRAPRGRSACR